MTTIQFYLILFFCLLSQGLHAQLSGVAVYYNIPDAIKGQKKDTSVVITYQDSSGHFSIQAPVWLKLRDTGKNGAIGGTFKVKNGEEAAIIVKSFSRYTFNNFDEYAKWVVRGMITGRQVPWSNEHICIDSKENEKLNGSWPDFSVILKKGDVTYYCRYVLAETENTFLWIDYTATQFIYEPNMKKFDEFLKGVKIIK